MACRSCLSPIGAVGRGIVAGLAGTFAHDFFFAFTRKLAPAPVAKPFVPPDPRELGESQTGTVARRFVEDLMKRGPLQNEERAGRIVHYAYGSALGAIYGLVAGSYPAAASVPGGLVFGTAAWALKDNVLLPAFKLAAGPTAYPARTHAHALAAYAVYGAAAAGAFAALAMEPTAWRPAAAQLGAAWVTRKIPARSRLRSPARRIVRSAILARWRARDLTRAVLG